MKLFLDTSTLLAACGSATGASRFIIDSAESCGWTLITSGYCEEETIHNLPKLGPGAFRIWKNRVMPALEIVPAEVVLDRVLMFPRAKIARC